MQRLMSDDGVPASNYTLLRTSAHVPLYTRTHTQLPNFSKNEMIKWDKCLSTENTDMVISNRLRDFPFVLSTLSMNE